jgi:acetoin utilization protein AcuC
MQQNTVPEGTLIYLDPQLENYGFPDGHPFSTKRYQAFADEFMRQGLDQKVKLATHAPLASPEDVLRFHTQQYFDFLKAKEDEGVGYFDYGDTPVFKGAIEAALRVVGAGLDAVSRIMNGEAKNAFNPIGGLHHAFADAASGFCILNDCAIIIKTLQQQYDLKTIAYIDIDGHHGDGVFYGFENDPSVIFADIHQQYIFPGTGDRFEIGKHQAQGTKLNIPAPALADDDFFYEAWAKVEHHLDQFPIDFIILQAGVDSLAWDPLTELGFSSAIHLHAATRLAHIANQKCNGRLVALGGGGYSLDNIAQGWVNVVKGLLNAA